jgi:phosphomethylpyrimidine synthase
MKITQEVREFARQQNTGDFVAAEADPLRNADGGAGPTPPLTENEAEAGMAEMSEKFRERGGEIYLPAAE